MKKLGIIAIVAMLFAVLAASGAMAVELKDGYYQIGSKADLEWFRDEVNAGNGELKAKLTADIDLQGSESNQWTPIGGGYPNYFKGEFDGQNHTISGLYVKNKQYSGLFGYAGDATIKNLTVNGKIVANTVTNTYGSGSGGYAGGICAHAEGIWVNGGAIAGTGTTIDSCISNVTISGIGATIGGICGHAVGVVKNCVNNGPLVNEVYIGSKGEHDVNAGRTGGIVGSADPYDECKLEIINCANKGSISDKSAAGSGDDAYLGGICGSARCRGKKSSVKIENCTNEGSVTGVSGASGGICGRIKLTYDCGFEFTIADSKNKGAVTNDEICGGAIGKVDRIDDDGKLSTDLLIITNSGYVKGTAEKGVGKWEGDEPKVIEYSEEPTPDKPEPPVIDPSVDIPKDIEKEPEVKPAEKEDVPVFADSIKIAGNGTAYVKTDTAKEIITKVFTSETIDTVTPLPIFKATVTEPNKVVAVSVNLKGSKIKETAGKIEDIDLRKLTSKTNALKYTRISDAAKAVDGTFMILDGFGKIASGEIKDNTVYQIVMFIKDNGEYDLDKTEKVVLDPATLVKTSSDKPSPSGSGGGGGCSAGFGMLALLFATPLFCRKKR